MKEYITVHTGDIDYSYGYNEKFSRRESRVTDYPVNVEGRLQMLVRNGWQVIAVEINCDCKNGYPKYHFVLEREVLDAPEKSSGGS